MSTDDQRFGGIARLYGRDGLARLQAAHVAVVGIGGVGSWAAEALARSGVGEISLFDLDDVCVTNTNRQVHAIEGTVGKAKVEVMAERIRAINPACVVHAVADFVTRETMAEYITEQLDAVIDCIDSVAAKGRADCLVQAAQDPDRHHRWCGRADRSDPDPGHRPQQDVQ